MTRRLTRDGLVQAFHGYGRDRSQWLTGAEFERHLLDPSGKPLAYFGTPGVKWLLDSLQADGGWSPVLEGDNVIALMGGGASVTLEPGGQFELSGAPWADLDELWREASQFTAAVDAHLRPHGIRQLALGFTPFADISDIPWVPKGRYVVMRDHLAATGSLAHHMMKGTCAVQASYDYLDEADCARKVQLATGLGPLTTAMFANSPLARGAPSGFMSYRGHIWTQTDPARTGLPDAAAAFSFERWVDYLLDAPMMFRRGREGDWVSAGGQTFRSWMEEEEAPGEADWDLHQTSVFPEVRVKRQIEVRGADCVPLPLAMGFVALFKGLFYCERALNDATELMNRFVHIGSRDERFDTACRSGLRGVVGGRMLAEWAEELVELSDAALERCAPEDRRWLHPLISQIERGESPARSLLSRWESAPTVESLLEAADMRADQPPLPSHSLAPDRTMARGLKAARLAERVVGLSRRTRSELQRRDPADISGGVRKARKQLKKLRHLLQDVQERTIERGLDHESYAAICKALRPLEAELDATRQHAVPTEIAELARNTRHAIRAAIELG
ncbi:MAG: glutamate--cysteine ligase [Myxococcota bacterium]|jgi:glutamate--cysteine ligase